MENTKIQKIPRTLQDTGDTESLSAIERQKHFLKRCTFQTWNSKLTSPIPSYNNSDFLWSDTDWYCKTNGKLTNAWNKKKDTEKNTQPKNQPNWKNVCLLTNIHKIRCKINNTHQHIMLNYIDSCENLWASMQRRLMSRRGMSHVNGFFTTEPRRYGVQRRCQSHKLTAFGLFRAKRCHSLMSARDLLS